ncbi:Dual specificity protein phosphatase 8 [Collichthys lucidus]|uniref:protein-tyrosine-phosphatase n=1 Tax=Collichthys lucidus TaxID=240159 RepID=A0A4U5VIS8_COLLU|nr:Dual specificity protein phosphatase 8 [Collichthys lucidus]
MVWSREREAERLPLSVIMPRLYLGAESDVTQLDLLSHCAVCSDAAMSSGASVLVHCAAGISRSPALAVAYIMYSLGMDLDHAYRFVKERRPSISPNFNFLGQLQHFQSTLTQKASGGDLLIQQLDNRPPSINDSVNHTHSSQNMNHQADSLISGLAEVKQAHREDFYYAKDTLQRHSPSGGRGKGNLPYLPFKQQPSQQARRSKSKTVHDREMREWPKAKTQNNSCFYRQAQDTNGDQSLPHSKCSQAEVKEQGLLSPFSFTLNKLLYWGERVLLGGVFVHPVRMGQPALPSRC